MVIAPPINTGTFGVTPQDAGVAAAAVTVGQMLGGSVGTSPLNTIFAGALLRPGPLDQQGTASQAHGKVPTAQASAGPARPA
jgi:hypothetical protein